MLTWRLHWRRRRTGMARQLSKALASVVQDMGEPQLVAHLSVLRRDIRVARQRIRAMEKRIATLERPPAMQRRLINEYRAKVRELDKQIRLRLHRLAQTEAILAMRQKARRGSE